MTTATVGTSPLLDSSEIAIRVRGLNARYRHAYGVRDINLDFAARKITAIIGPSGCGKSTLLRCLNRMHEVVKGAAVEGEVRLGEFNIYDKGVDAAEIRQRVGMVFQRPNPFPTMSIWENAGVAGRLMGYHGSELNDMSELALKRAGLWEEVSTKLKNPAISLSGGQQQRLCIARCLVAQPEIILMDEPCSALDPAATIRIEDLMRELASEFTVVIVTHNMHQAARASDYTLFMLAEESDGGRVIEYADTDSIFTQPADERTEAYVTGRFG